MAAGREPPPPPPPPREDRVIVAFEGPDWQRRSTVLFRAVMAFPHFVWLGVVSLGAVMAVVVGWFAALFTGRVPDGIVEYLAKVLQYQTRVMAYGYLVMTDDYPRFSLNDVSHSLAVETSPGEFNRLAVLFRGFLMFPSVVVSGLALAGAQVVGLVGWVCTLVLGRMPNPLFQADLALLRYQTRMNAFAFMLTAEQPRGLFRSDPVFVKPTGSGVFEPESDVPEIGDWPRMTRLVLSSAAKRLLVLFLVLGAVGVALDARIATTVADGGLSHETRGQVVRTAHDRLGASLVQFNTDVRGCSGDGQLDCLRAADQRFALAFDAFDAKVAKVKSNPSFNASDVAAKARACATALRARAAAVDAAAYDAAASSVTRALTEFDDAYAALFPQQPAG